MESKARILANDDRNNEGSSKEQQEVAAGLVVEASY